MKIMQKSLVFSIALSMLSASSAFSQTVSGQNEGLTVPAPVFQNGDTPSLPNPDGGAQAQEFVDFYNQTYLKNSALLPVLTKDKVVWFPPQRAGDTSLELVVRETQPNTANCTPGDPGYPPVGYPIVCREDFSTGQFCQACHDSALYVEGGGLPEMTYIDQHDTWLANWSQYGDWSASIMRLATRDPIWQAQIETETNTHPYADPHVIQDTCFSCHGEMGERQLKTDIQDFLDKKKPQIGEQYKKVLDVDDAQLAQSRPFFCTDVFYATIPGVLSNNERGKPFPFSDDCAPIAGKSVADHQELYAKYGSLSRDGVSCETCHRIAPKDGSTVWDGTDFQVFYGHKDTYNVSKRLESEIKHPLDYEFTATFQTDMNHIMAPSPLDTLDAVPMQTDDNLTLAYAGEEGSDEDYLGKSVVCGACHVLIVPQIPTAFKPDAPLPTAAEAPYYERPTACASDTFAPATRGIYGNPIQDQCVGLGFEQATYLEWINSSFASEEANDNTCQGCHMPLVSNPENLDDHRAVLAQATPDLNGKTYRRHRLMGINLPVSEMFMQFPDVLGVAAFSQNVPDYAPLPNGEELQVIQNYLLNGQQAIVEQATSQANGSGWVEGADSIVAKAAVKIDIKAARIAYDKLHVSLELTNNTGHKYPSGAGFRRSFIRFEAFNEDGDLIWVSGQTNKFGAICNGPCVQADDGSYNLLPSETAGLNPQNLQPHHSVVSRENQVQIYEVQAVDDIGNLTSKTLALFHDAKDNRILPAGYALPEKIDGCSADVDTSVSIFGITKCQAAYATQPQLEPLTIGSDIAKDPDYNGDAPAGSDRITYWINLDEMGGEIPTSVRATLEYQATPPGFLAARFQNGYDIEQDAYLPATERSIYLTSHLNLDLDLKSENPANEGLVFSQNWTTSIYQAELDVTVVP
jgi:hypothetical protein